MTLSGVTEFPAQQLRKRFIEVGYRIDQVLERITPAGQAGLTRNSTVAASQVVANTSDPQATLITLWLLQQPVSTEQLERAVGAELVTRLTELGVVRQVGHHFLAEVDLRPYGYSEDQDGWIISDLTPGLDGKQTQLKPDYVLGVSPASTTLAQLTMPKQVKSALDLGTGCGVQSLHLAQHTNKITATDLNPRAVRFARWTAEINQVDCEVKQGNLFDPVDGQQFDLIVTNPPYVMTPPKKQADQLTYRETGFVADGVMETIIKQAPRYLSQGGSLQIVGNWAQIADQPWQDRLGAWFAGSECEVWVTERESLDPYEYIEIWLADAGLLGTDTYHTAYLEWLDYFKQLNIQGVSMGWILATKNSPQNGSLVHCESWPYEVNQPVGQAYQLTVENADLARGNRTEIAGAHLKLVDGITQETFGSVGAEDPSALVIRQGSGFKRAEQVSTEIAAFLGACDGDLTVAQLISAVALVLGDDENEVADQVYDRVRSMLLSGFLQQIR